MATDLTDQAISDTYDQLLHVDDGPTTAEKAIYSGAGVATALKLGTESASVDNVRIDGSTISTVDSNSDLVLAPNGSGKVQIGNVNITGGQLFGVTPTAAGVALLDDVDAAAQRTTLGLGTAAIKNVGTSGSSVPVLNGDNTFSGETVFTGKVGIGGLPNILTNRALISDTITDNTTSSLYAQSNVADPSGEGHICFNFLAVPTSVYSSPNIVISLASNITAQNENAIEQVRNFSASTILTGGGSINRRFGYIDAGLNLANGTITDNYAFYADMNNVGATNNYGFYSAIPEGGGRWNFYAAGSAQNRFQGRTVFATGFARTPTVSTAPNGSTIVLTNATNHLLYNNTSPVATLTINLPTDDLANGQEITIATRSAITTLTVSGGSRPVYGAPTTLSAGGFATFIYSSAADAWFRKG